eukprot:400962-Pyramimonas_sp.AAC.1
MASWGNHGAFLPLFWAFWGRFGAVVGPWWGSLGPSWGHLEAREAHRNQCDKAKPTPKTSTAF